MRGSGSPPAATASRSDQPPAQKTAKRARLSPWAWRTQRRLARRSAPSTAQPVTTSPPAASTSSRERLARRRWKSTTAVAGECSASTPRTCGSISAISSRAQPAQARDAVGAAAALELVEPRDARPRTTATISLPSWRAGIPRSSQYVEQLAARPRCRGGPSASRARSRCRRAGRRSCGRSGGSPRPSSRSSTVTRAVGLPRQQLAGDREADDAGAHDDDVGLLPRHGQARRLLAPTAPLGTVDRGMPEAAQDPRIDELLAGLNPPQRDAVDPRRGAAAHPRGRRLGQDARAHAPDRLPDAHQARRARTRSSRSRSPTRRRRRCASASSCSSAAPRARCGS